MLVCSVNCFILFKIYLRSREEEQTTTYRPHVYAVACTIALLFYQCPQSRPPDTGVVVVIGGCLHTSLSRNKYCTPIGYFLRIEQQNCIASKQLNFIIMQSSY